MLLAGSTVMSAPWDIGATAAAAVSGTAALLLTLVARSRAHRPESGR